MEEIQEMNNAEPNVGAPKQNRREYMRIYMKKYLEENPKARERKKLQVIEWRKRNPEKVKAMERRSREKKRKKILEGKKARDTKPTKERKKRSPEKAKANKHAKEKSAKTPEEIKVINRERAKEWRRQNPDKVKARNLQRKIAQNGVPRDMVECLKCKQRKPRGEVWVSDWLMSLKMGSYHGICPNCR